MNKLHEVVKKFEKDHSIIWAYPEAKNRFYRELEQEVGFLGSGWHKRHNGTSIASIEDHLRAKARNGFTKNTITAKYDSPFKPRSEEKLNDHKKFMRELIESQFKAQRTAFTSAEAKEKVIEILSSNFIASDTDDGIRFHRIYNNAIPSPASWSFDELTEKAGIKKYIDSVKTEVAYAFHKNELLSHATKMVEDPKNQAQIDRAIEKLKQVEGYRTRVGRKLVVDEGAIQKEFKQNILKEMAVDYDQLTMHEMNKIDSQTALSVDKHLNTLEPVRQQIDAIENIQSRPGTWDF